MMNCLTPNQTINPVILASLTHWALCLSQCFIYCGYACD